MASLWKPESRTKKQDYRLTFSPKIGGFESTDFGQKDKAIGLPFLVRLPVFGRTSLGPKVRLNAYLFR